MANVALDPSRVDPAAHDHPKHHAGFWSLTLGSIGVVYGDIGTSPLYAFRTAITAAAGEGAVTTPMVLGVLSLILWSLIVIVTIKYVMVLLYLDNNGEGGMLALMALANKALGGAAPLVMMLGLVGAALFYGDSIITPAISVLSAVEGLKLATPLFEPYVVPITLVLIAILFAAQSRGTAKVASLFGPIMLIWFVVIALLGLIQIAKNPSVFWALNPGHGLSFIATHGYVGLLVIGAVFLAVTGGEALYADLGHFGRKPIQTAWLYFVFPALAINYLGQGALLLSDPKAIENPFYKMVPAGLLIPMVALAATATVIASQAVITGAYSLSRQAIQLGFLPRLDVRHTSASQAGQIYMPQVNVLLFIGVVCLVLIFRTSDNLASAYGIAVTGAMIIDTSMAMLVIWALWKWPLPGVIALAAVLLSIELLFFGANLLKVFEGGWVTLSVAATLMLLMMTWRRGTDIIVEKTRKSEVPLSDLIHQLEQHPPQVVPGTAIFLTSQRDYAPTALLHTLKHFKVLHDRVVIMSVETIDEPRVNPSEALTIEQLSPRFWRIKLTCGFMETPHIPKALAQCRKIGWKYDIMSTSFFLSRRSIKPATPSKMPLWRDNLFIMLANNAIDATEYFRIPKDRVVEVGTQVGI
jgi:KUP system potassium uptake protein